MEVSIYVCVRDRKLILKYLLYPGNTSDMIYLITITTLQDRFDCPSLY